MITLRRALLVVVLSCTGALVNLGLAGAQTLSTASLDESFGGFVQGLTFAPTAGAALICEGAAGTSLTAPCGSGGSLSDLVVFGTPSTVSVVAGNNLPGTANGLNLHTIINGFATNPGVAVLISDLTVSNPPEAFADFLPSTDPAVVIANITNSNGTATPLVFLSEGAEDTNQIISYTPTSGQPGFSLTPGTTAMYSITSDTSAVPDPSTALLLGTGLLGFPISRRFSRDNTHSKERR